MRDIYILLVDTSTYLQHTTFLANIVLLFGDYIDWANFVSFRSCVAVIFFWQCYGPCRVKRE